MSMERLNRAAQAAGFAMAAPDDDDVVATVEPPKQSRELAVVASPAPRSTSEMLTGASSWLRGVLPTAIGGRAPA